MFFLGNDWAAAEHAVCLLGQAGRKVAAFTVDHTADGFARPGTRLRKVGHVERMPVAIERSDGRLVAALLEADPGNAETIADHLRERIHRLRRAAQRWPYVEGATAIRKQA